MDHFRLLLSFFISAILVTTTTSSIIYTNTQCTTVTLEPCKRHPSFTNSIFCENISDFHTFVRVLRCGSKENMQEVFLEKSTLEYLPLYVIDFCGYFFLNVKSVVLSKLLEGNVLIRLQQLHLDDVVIKNSSRTWEPLAILEKLLRFSVSNMAIRVLDGHLVDHLTWKLESLVLESTNTTALADTALEKFSMLEYVSIQHNDIAELKRSMFPTPARIKFFYFGHNKISSLPDDLFSEMPDLQHIALQGNLLSEIHVSTFRTVWNNLSNLHLDGNPMKCHCKMLWLAKKRGPHIFTGNCFAPKHQYGKPLKNLEARDFHCFKTKLHPKENMLLPHS
ncbi:hypothetical protein JTE90_017072 [Oedothorax gibbosus]|uniref:Uncharacterized protein n=1 Tax=Oedothorax gibbosus TaxID=931172 RepID=A0AAV6ULF6_9ARAC|nr:hypothetical protein JTE90_017072 [Oedothorax gibbosus]KAG8185053.1 hypothetical protein JTE90_017072 [Oedothorax gibbosus]KAG8185054.1 hypothetical protein JTE90_017072 [Oedothorax gibbosus]KAG8185055.1 hypothetical protein JTE90_017072 [Oedothorax gibbosus]